MRWPSARDRKASGLRRSEGMTRSASWSTTRWIRARRPRRNGVRPHINLTTTIEGLKNEVGAPPADLELSLPISTRTLERITCDCTMSRVLLHDCVEIDVGRAKRTVSGPTWRALRTRDRGCRFPGCDRPVEWSNPHHIIHWARGGPNNLPNLVLLCHFHHRLV